MAEINKTHVKIFGSEPEGVFKAAGRVNLIGEHTDYNDGYVLPTPINRHVQVSVNRRSDNRINMYSVVFNEYSSYCSDNFSYDIDHKWANYILGVVHALKERGYSIDGFDMCIAGNVPIGAGLSSSAALETAVAKGLNSLFNLGLDKVEMAYVGKECENNFIGVQSGIMDQFVSNIGEYGKALFIDCRNNEYSLHIIPDEIKIVIVNSMVNRSLADSEYNLRKTQCLDAVRIIREKYSEVNSLRDVSENILVEQWPNLPIQIAKRSRHVVTENQRVLDSVKLLERGDMFGFGELMYDSHDSLKHDYEISSKYLDLLVDFTMDLDGVLGSRLTGAGFGGCTVNLVENSYVEAFVNTITERYYGRTAKKCEIYFV